MKLKFGAAYIDVEDCTDPGPLTKRRKRFLVNAGGRKGKGDGHNEEHSPSVTKEDMAKDSSRRGKLAVILGQSSSVEG